jgi:hypothetical protein
MSTMTKTKLSTLSLLTLFAAMFFIAALSCNNHDEKGVWIPTPPDTSAPGKRNHFISREDLEVMRRQFGGSRDTILENLKGYFIPTSEAFNKHWLLEILKDPRCTGIRVYYGLKEGTPNGTEFRLMLVGIDEQGNDLWIRPGSELAGQAGNDGHGGVEWGQCEPPCSIKP